MERVIVYHRFPLTKAFLVVTIGNMNTARTFKQLRKRMRLTQAELSRMLGVSRAAVSRWESGKRGINSVLALLMKLLVQHQRRGYGSKSK